MSRIAALNEQLIVALRTVMPNAVADYFAANIDRWLGIEAAARMVVNAAEVDKSPQALALAIFQLREVVNAPTPPPPGSSETKQ